MEETDSVQPPDVSYARSGDVAIAYQVVGTGSPDILFVRKERLGILESLNPLNPLRKAF